MMRKTADSRLEGEHAREGDSGCAGSSREDVKAGGVHFASGCVRSSEESVRADTSLCASGVCRNAEGLGGDDVAVSSACAGATVVDVQCRESSARTDFVGMLRGAGLLLAGCAAAVLLFSAVGCSATDASGNVIATLTATKAFGCVLVSGAGVSDGDTITVSVDGSATTATASTTGTSGIAMGVGASGGMGDGAAMGGRHAGQGGPA